MARSAINARLAFVVDFAIGCLHRDFSHHACVERQHFNGGDVALGGNQAFFQRKRHHGREHVAAIGGGVYRFFFRLQLGKQKAQVGFITCTHIDYADFAGKRMRTAQAINLSLVWRTHGSKQYRIARGDVSR